MEKQNDTTLSEIQEFMHFHVNTNFPQTAKIVIHKFWIHSQYKYIRLSFVHAILTNDNKISFEHLTYVCVSISLAYLRVYTNMSNNNRFIKVTNHFDVVFVRFRIVRHTCRSKKHINILYHFVQSSKSNWLHRLAKQYRNLFFVSPPGLLSNYRATTFVVVIRYE